MAGVKQLKICIPKVVLMLRKSSSMCQRLRYSAFKLDLAVCFGHSSVVTKVLPPVRSSRTVRSCRRLLVVRLRHPVRFGDGLVQHDQMVARPQSLPAPKVGRVVRVTDQHVATREGIEDRTQERLFITALAVITIHSRIEQGATVQTNQPHHPADRKTQAWLLAARLRISGLIILRVRQRHRRTIDQPHRSATPTPRQRHDFGACAVMSCAVYCTSADTIACGKRWRALQ